MREVIRATPPGRSRGDAELLLRVRRRLLRASVDLGLERHGQREVRVRRLLRRLADLVWASEEGRRDPG